MTITALEAEPRSGGVRIQVDGRPFGTIGIADVSALGLVEGGELAETAAGELARRAEVFSARVVALRMLGVRPLPRAELVRRLVRKGHAKPVVEEAVAALGEAGLIDDARFAEHFVRTKAKRQSLGPRRLLGDLRRLGVAEKTANEAVSQVLEHDAIDTSAVLREAAEKKARSLRGLDPEVARRRLRSFLLRRGFGGREVARVVKELIG